MAFAGIDVRKSGGSLIWEAFLQDGSTPVAKVTSGTTTLRLYELQTDGSLKSFDFSDNTFKATTLTAATANMVHQTGNAGAFNTGVWTAVLDSVSGFTPGNIYLAQVHNAAAAPPDQTRKFQYGLADGDLAVSPVDGGVTIHAYAVGKDPAALLASPLANLQTHGDGHWSTASGFAVPGSKMDLVNAPNATAISALQNGLATSANATALLTAVNNLNNLSALANLFIADVLVRPSSGSIAYPFAVVVRDSEGLVVDLDAAPAIAATNAAGTDRSSRLSAVNHVATGVYAGSYTVQSSDVDEGLSFVATGTVSSVARRADAKATVASADSLTALAAIQAQTALIGTNAMDSPNTLTAQAAAQAAATQSASAASQAATAAGNTATLLTNLAAVELHAANADAQSAAAATQAANAATQAGNAATALGTAGSGLTNLPPVSLTTAYNLYLADVNFTKNSATGTDEYTVVWSKNGLALNGGVTAAAIQVNNRDGSTLLAQTAMVGPNNGIFYHNETASRTTAGAPVDVVVTATIDGTTRTFSKTVGRDA